MADETLMSLKLLDLNSHAAGLRKAGDSAAALGTWQALFAKAARSNMTHPEMHAVHGNASAAALDLELWQEALNHAQTSRELAEASLRRNGRASGTYIKSFARESRALMGLGRLREAVTAAEAGLKADPADPALRLALEDARSCLAKQILEGAGSQTIKALTYPEPRQRISFHPASTPLHRLKPGDALPLKLLTPFQAENDPALKDTYNYATVQCDVRAPRRAIRWLEDGYLLSRLQAGVESAVRAVAGNGERDVRVLDLAAGTGVLSATALRAGARHVTAVERWLYLALLSKQVLDANGFKEEQFKVLYKRPTDLVLNKDVPVAANLILAPLLLDEGLLSSGLVPSVSHALSALSMADALVLPASATVFVQPVEIVCGRPAGVNLAPADSCRWHPAYAAGVPHGPGAVNPLGPAVEAWHFDLVAPPTESGVKTLDLEFDRGGRWNAVRFWFRLRLHGDIELSTGPDAEADGLTALRPGVQYLQGGLEVGQGNRYPLLATHNTVRLRFDLESAEYANVCRRDASFPPRTLGMLADATKYEAYSRALRRAVLRLRERDGEVHVLDAGAGAGVLATLAARAGADSVVVAANGVSRTVSVVQRDVACLQRGRDIRPLGANLVVADLFDAGLLGDGVQYLLQKARERVLQPDALVVPAAATVYCMGIEAGTESAGGFDVRAINQYRWDDGVQNVRLASFPHKVLTKPAQAAEVFFDGERRGRIRHAVVVP